MKIIIDKKELIEPTENYKNIDIEILNENGLSVQFYISAENFYELYVKHLYTKDEIITSPILPLNTVFYQEKESYITIVVKYPEVKAKFNYSGYIGTEHKKFQFPVIFPECVIFYQFYRDEVGSACELVKSRIFAVKFQNWMEFINGKNNKLNLYYYPYPNQSPSYSTGICWGSSNKHIILPFENNNFYRLTNYYHYYINSEFNSDLGFNISGYSPKSSNDVFNMFTDFFEVERQEYENYSYEEIDKQINLFNYDKLIIWKSIDTLEENF